VPDDDVILELLIVDEAAIVVRFCKVPVMAATVVGNMSVILTVPVPEAAKRGTVTGVAFPELMLKLAVPVIRMTEKAFFVVTVTVQFPTIRLVNVSVPVAFEALTVVLLGPTSE
jgi:hypothetical protein